MMKKIETVDELRAFLEEFEGDTKLWHATPTLQGVNCTTLFAEATEMFSRDNETIIFSGEVPN